MTRCKALRLSVSTGSKYAGHGEPCTAEATHGEHCWVHAQRKRTEQRETITFPVRVLGVVR